MLTESLFSKVDYGIGLSVNSLSGVNWFILGKLYLLWLI